MIFASCHLDCRDTQKMRPSASALWSLPAWLAGYLVGRLMPFYGPQAGQKRAMAASKGREEGKREQIEPQAKRQREPSWLGLVSCGWLRLGGGH